MVNPDNTDPDHAEQLFDRTLEFNDGTTLHAVAWDVPANEAYPDGIHYRFHFGSPTGTIIRYDNAHDGRHERHNPDGTVEAVDFPGVVELYERFLREVGEWRNERRIPDKRTTMTEQDPDTDRSETERVLEIRVQNFDSFASESVAALDEAMATRDGNPSVLAFETPRQALRLLSDARFELLETIRTENPESIRELARLVDRDVSIVHKDLELLAEHDIVELHTEGRNKRPTVAYEEIHIDVDLSFESDSGSETPARS